MIQVGIIGATGYAGGELVRLLYGHKDTAAAVLQPYQLFHMENKESHDGR